jgi:hypothetical protein
MAAKVVISLPSQLFRHIQAPEGERPAALVVDTVTGEGLERVARNAIRVGIGWILLNRSVTYLEGCRARPPRFVVRGGVRWPGRLSSR